MGSGLVCGLASFALIKVNRYIKFVFTAIVGMALVAVHFYFHLVAGEFLCVILFGYILS